MPTEHFKEGVTALRVTIAALVADTVQLKEEIVAADTLEGQNKGEMIANLTLGYRHLEDAAMRLGKAIQAADGGVSPLGGPKTPSQ